MQSTLGTMRAEAFSQGALKQIATWAASSEEALNGNAKELQALGQAGREAYSATIKANQQDASAFRFLLEALQPFIAEEDEAALTVARNGRFD